jgi:hypothetical protein
LATLAGDVAAPSSISEKDLFAVELDLPSSSDIVRRDLPRTPKQVTRNGECDGRCGLLPRQKQRGGKGKQEPTVRASVKRADFFWPKPAFCLFVCFVSLALCRVRTPTHIRVVGKIAA